MDRMIDLTEAEAFQANLLALGVSAIRSPEDRVLEALHDAVRYHGRPVRVGEVASEAQVSHQRTSELLKRLVASGRVLASRDPLRMSVMVYLPRVV